MCNTYDVICTENLDIKQMSSLPNMGKSTMDNAYGLFVEMLKYKMEERGKKLLQTDRYYPSSKTCSQCGAINRTLTVNDRTWKCPICGSVLDRDINAATNIRNKCIYEHFGRRVFGQSL